MEVLKKYGIAINGIPSDTVYLYKETAEEIADQVHKEYPDFDVAVVVCYITPDETIASFLNIDALNQLF